MVGDVQVFNDEECTEYFDGQSNICYVRLNNGLAFNGAYTWGDNQHPNTYLGLSAPDDEFPTDGYGITAYVNYRQNPYTAGPYAAGSVHRMAAAEGTTIANPVTEFQVL